MKTRMHGTGIAVLRRSWVSRFVVVPLTLAAVLSGCYWSVPDRLPAGFVAYERPSKIRLYLATGHRPVLTRPTVIDGHISGFVGDSLVMIPLEDVVGLEHRRTSLFAIAGSAAALGLVAAIVTMPRSSGGRPSGGGGAREICLDLVFGC